MTWGDIKVLWLLALVPILVVAYALDGQRRRRLLERIGHLPMIARMTASFSPARRRWRSVLLVTGVALLVGVLARPEMPGRAKLTESRGLDLVVALDFSRSMLARDVYPTRLERAKAELARFIDTLHGDRVGLVAFAGETLSYPLTVDYEAAKLFWRDLAPDDMPVGGTDIGAALTASTELLTRVRAREGKKRPAQVILLLTDGEDTEGHGMEAARKAASLGIKIYTLGIGSDEKPPVPLYDENGKQNGYVTDQAGDPVRVGLDAASLKQMAALSGGEYVPLDAQRFGVERVQQAIAGLERTEEEARFQREPDDVGRWFLVPAFLALVAAACVRERRRPAKQRAAQAAAAAAREPTGETTQRALAALLLLAALPMLTGFDLLKRKDPNLEQGNKLLQAGKAAAALEAYDRAVEALPEEPIAHFDRGVALYELGKFPEAQKEFLRASEGHDASLKADAYYNMGNSLLKQERFKEALDAYKHTLGLRPDDRRAKWNLELALRRLQEQKQKQQQQQSQQNQQQQQQQKQQQQNQQQQQQQQQQAQQKPDDQQQQQQAQQQQQQQQQSRENEQKQQAEQQPGDEQQRDEQQKMAQRAAKKEQPREIDKQDAEAVLDALERVEPTVQKDLARRHAGGRRPTKDW